MNRTSFKRSPHLDVVFGLAVVFACFPCLKSAENIIRMIYIRSLTGQLDYTEMQQV
jgi:hypothetical protein